MSSYRVVVDWRLEGDFGARRYSRAHTLHFAHGVTVPGSASTSVVPPPWSRQDAVDPDSAFTAALSACHMLWFLDLAARAGFVAESYRDEAEGTLAKGPDGKLMMTRVVLRPAIGWGGEWRPTAEEVEQLHHRAHEECFIANSVKTEVVVEPQAGT
jgi:organic hydroperoxide reductase OsmC/OhrA